MTLYDTVREELKSAVGIVKAIAAAAGKEVNIVRYDPSTVEIPKGKGFPFRCDPLRAGMPMYRVHDVHSLECSKAKSFLTSTLSYSCYCKDVPNSFLKCELSINICRRA